MLALALGIIVSTGHAEVWNVYLMSLLLGFVNVVDNPARQTFVLEMVGREDLPNAVSLNSVVMNSSRVVGPAIGGVLIAAFGIAPCFYINAASYVAVIVALVDDGHVVAAPAADRRAGEGPAPRGLALRVVGAAGARSRC